MINRPRANRRRVLARVRSGFTLTELLIAISILAVLGGMALSVIRGARYDANAARSETQIKRIEQFLNQRLEEYAVRALPLRLASLRQGAMPLQPAQMTGLRNRILIEYVTGEMPCDPSQITPVSASPPPWTNFVSAHFATDFGAYTDAAGNALTDLLRLNVPPQFLIRPPSLLPRLSRRMNGAGTVGDDAYCAECLYEILNSHNDAYTSGLDALFSDEIGDTDGDGHLEVLDAWGDPMVFYVTLDPIPPGPGIPSSANGGLSPVTLLNQYTSGSLPSTATSDGPLAVRFYVKSKNLLDR